VECHSQGFGPGIAYYQKPLPRLVGHAGEYDGFYDVLEFYSRLVAVMA